MFHPEAGESLNYLPAGFPVLQHLQDLPDHDTGALESKLAMADVRVGNDVSVNLNCSHKMCVSKGIYKTFARPYSPPQIMQKWLNVPRMQVKKLKEQLKKLRQQ